MATRLGKGLGALIPDVTPEELATKGDRLREIDVARISPNPFQPREEFDEKAMAELQRSIAEKGLVQPITVRPHDGGYQLIMGERRLRAVKALGLQKVPAFVLEVQSDVEMLELSLIENIQREDLNPIDVARAYHRLVTECHLSQEDVAKRVGKDRSTVTNFMRLLKLPKPIQDSLRRNELDMGHARALITVTDQRRQLALWKRIVRDKLSVRQVENLVKSRPPEKVAAKAAQAQRLPAEVQKLENRLRQRFGTQVRIHYTPKGGSIEIEFYSDEDLERIVDVMEGISRKI